MTLTSIEADTWLWVTAVSATLFIVSILALHQVVIRMPCDHFSPSRRKAGRTRRNVVGHFVKNLVGALIIAAGIIMLFTPGQGVLSILIGVTLVDFPGKYRFERWLLRRPGVLSGINHWRERAGRGALIVDD